FELPTLSLHDALPILTTQTIWQASSKDNRPARGRIAVSSSSFGCQPTLIMTAVRHALSVWNSSSTPAALKPVIGPTCRPCARKRSEEHTSELQSRFDL